MKFTKLYDNTEFSNVTQMFSETTYLDYGITSDIDNETKDTIVWAIDESPSGFRVPKMSIIEKLIR